MKIEELTYAAVLHGDMQIPVSLLGQNMRISVDQLREMERGGSLVIEYSYDGIEWVTAPTDTPYWIRFSNDGGATFSPAIRVNTEARTMTEAEIKGLCNTILK